jgi:hypothetical protein
MSFCMTIQNSGANNSHEPSIVPLNDQHWVNHPLTKTKTIMSTKEQKTRDELTAIIMARIRAHPEWNDIISVAITQTVQSAPYRHNWVATFTHNGQAVAPEGAFRIITELQNKYDLSAD